MQDSAHYVLGVGPCLLELYKTVIKLETVPHPQDGDHTRLCFSYDDFKKEVEKKLSNGISLPAKTILTATEFFQTVCALVTEVAVLRDLAAEALLTFPPEQGAIPLSLLHDIVRALFPTVEQTLQALVLDQVAIIPSEPLATDDYSAVNIKRLEIRNSPALFAQPGLLKQLIEGFGKIEELILVGGLGAKNTVKVNAKELPRSASPLQVTERIILEFPEGEFPHDILEFFGYSIPANILQGPQLGLGGLVEGNTRLTSILVDKSREKSPSSATLILGGTFSGILAVCVRLTVIHADVITYEDSVSDFNVATKGIARNAAL